MRLAIPLALLLAATTSRSGCGDDSRPYEPCAGKACGDRCALCPPDATDCGETAVVKACDPFGRCVPEVPELCAAVLGPCEGKGCGAECVIEPPCATADPPCLMPSVLGHCDPRGACYPGIPPPGFCLPHPDCSGKACGRSCNPCGPDRTCPTLIPSACDRFGACVGDVPWLCYEPCAAKATGACCTLCPPGASGCFETMVLKACDASAACVPAASCAP